VSDEAKGRNVGMQLTWCLGIRKSYEEIMSSYELVQDVPHIFTLPAILLMWVPFIDVYQRAVSKGNQKTRTLDPGLPWVIAVLKVGSYVDVTFWGVNLHTQSVQYQDGSGSNARQEHHMALMCCCAEGSHHDMLAYESLFNQKGVKLVPTCTPFTPLAYC
jgi:hypothetical protein